MLGSWPSTRPSRDASSCSARTAWRLNACRSSSRAGMRSCSPCRSRATTGRHGWQPSFRADASAAGVPILQPDDLNAQEVIDEVRATNPDFLVSFQAGQILRRALLSVPVLGAWNLHFGSLPRYRGVAPIAWAIINGERSTGVTLHRIDPGVDSGAILATAEVPIEREDTGRSLYDKCTDAGIRLFGEWWPRLRTGAVETRAQESDDVLYYNRHSIDFSLRDDQLAERLRGHRESRASPHLPAIPVPDHPARLAGARGSTLQLGSRSRIAEGPARSWRPSRRASSLERRVAGSCSRSWHRTDIWSRPRIMPDLGSSPAPSSPEPGGRERDRPWLSFASPRPGLRTSGCGRRVPPRHP